MKKLMITFLASLTIFSVCYSQTRETLVLNKSYSLAKIYKKSNQIVKGRDLKLINDSSLTYKNNTTYQVETMDLHDLRSLKVKSGTKALPFALYGAGLMALSSLWAWAEVKSDPYLETKENAGGIIAGFIVGGAVIGALVGMATPKWKSISIPRKDTGRTSFYLNPLIGVQKDYFAFGFNVKF